MKLLKDEILGHDDVIAKAEAALGRGGMVGLTLFVGPDGVGKKKVAFALAQFLLCENKNRPCGTCGACQRVVAGSSESLLYIEPQTSQLKLEQAKEISQFCQLSNPGHARVIIVDKSDKMNKQAANSLLKVLEEPPDRTYFFFIAPHPRSVIPTLRSRAQVLRFANIDLDLLSEKLTAPQWVIEASGGRMDRIEALQSEENIELRANALNTLKVALENSDSSYLEALKDMTLGREAAATLLRFWKEFLRDAWVAQENIARPIHPDLGNELDFLKSRSLEQITHMFESLTEIEKGFRSNIDIQISFENFLRQGQRA